MKMELLFFFCSVPLFVVCNDGRQNLYTHTRSNLHPAESSVSEMPMVWIFPYFFEPRILDCFPAFTMLDYQVMDSASEKKKQKYKMLHKYQVFRLYF